MPRRRRPSARCCSSRASARASTSTAPSATPRSGCATSPRSRTATTTSCRRRSTPRASCATTPSTSASIPTRSSSAGATRWSTTRRSEAVAVMPPPMPLVEPRRGLTITPGMLVAAVLTLIILAFVGYIGLQLARLQPVDAGRADRSDWFASCRRRPSDVPAGTGRPSPPRPSRITGPGDYHGTTDADDAGDWSILVPVTKGRNDFTVIANDPVTRRDRPAHSTSSSPCPFLERPRRPIGAGRQTPAIPAPALAVTAPTEGAVVEGGLVAIAGTTAATTVVATASQRRGTRGDAGPERIADGRTDRQCSPAATPTGPAPVALDGRERSVHRPDDAPAGTLDDHRHGRSAAGLSDAIQTRTVDVTFAGLTVVVDASAAADACDRAAWEDGRRVRGTGRVADDGETLTLQADTTVTCSTGNSGATTSPSTGRRSARSVVGARSRRGSSRRTRTAPGLQLTDTPELVRLAERIQAACIERARTLATAESCTGGLIGHVLTEVSGSSAYYVGGAISYSDRSSEPSLACHADGSRARRRLGAGRAWRWRTGARERFSAATGGRGDRHRRAGWRQRAEAGRPDLRRRGRRRRATTCAASSGRVTARRTSSTAPRPRSSWCWSASASERDTVQRQRSAPASRRRERRDPSAAGERIHVVGAGGRRRIGGGAAGPARRRRRDRLRPGRAVALHGGADRGRHPPRLGAPRRRTSARETAPSSTASR